MVEENASSDENYRNSLEKVGKLLLSTVRQMPDSVIVSKLRSLGLEVDCSIMDEWCSEFMSAQELSANLRREHDWKYEGNEDDWIWMGLTTLWERWFPNAPNFEMLDDKIDAGYQIDAADFAGICEAWLAAYSDAHKLMHLHDVKSLNELDEMFCGTQSIFNWMQDFTQALYDAGLHEPKYLWDRIRVCNDILQLWQRDDRLTLENAQRDLAESYFLLHDTDKAESLFREYLEADPQWGWSWIGWSDCYHFLDTKFRDLDVAENILKRGLEIPNVRDRVDMLERLLSLYEKAGKPQEAQQVRAELEKPRHAFTSEIVRTREDSIQVRHKMDFGEEGVPLDEIKNLSRHARPPAPAKPPVKLKVGRNAPCPCGSGKKYKKCCMQKR